MSKDVITLKVEQCTKTVNGNYMNKLVGQGETVSTAFGEVEGGKRTFYMFTDTKNQKGTEGELDLNNFDIVKKEYEFVDEEGKDQVATLSYLYPKRG